MYKDIWPVEQWAAMLLHLGTTSRAGISSQGLETSPEYVFLMGTQNTQRKKPRSSASDGGK